MSTRKRRHPYAISDARAQKLRELFYPPLYRSPKKRSTNDIIRQLRQAGFIKIRPDRVDFHGLDPNTNPIPIGFTKAGKLQIKLNRALRTGEWKRFPVIQKMLLAKLLILETYHNLRVAQLEHRLRVYANRDPSQLERMFGLPPTVSFEEIERTLRNECKRKLREYVAPLKDKNTPFEDLPDSVQNMRYVLNRRNLARVAMNYCKSRTIQEQIENEALPLWLEAANLMKQGGLDKHFRVE